MGRPKGSKNKKYTVLGIDAKSKEWLGYRDHRNSARYRKIPFLLTFTEWVSIWNASGKFHLRGRDAGCYVMARFGDQGAYVVGNVEIITHEANSAQPHWGKQYMLGTKQSKATKKKRGESLRRFYSIPENVKRRSEVARRGWQTRRSMP